MPSNASHRRLALVLFALCLFSYASFRHGDGNHNVISRIALTYSLLDGTGPAIDAYHARTDDKALRAGHYYSDKAPGLALLALPSVWLAGGALGLAGSADSLEARVLEDGEFTRTHRLLCYAATLATSGLATALAVVAVFGVVLRARGDPGAALFAGLTYGLGTIAFGFALLFMGHALAGALLTGAFAVFWRIDREGTRDREPALAALGGALLGWAVVTEYPTGPIALALAGIVLVRSAAWPAARRIRVLGPAFAGGVVALAPLPLYNDLAFGSPFAIGYSNLAGWEEMETGFFGIGAPRLERLYGITFSPYRGLFFFSPILLAAAPGWLRMLRDRAERPWALWIGASFVYLLLVNAGYHYWAGGWSTGPRHLVPVIPLLCVPLGHLWATSGRRARGALVALLALSAAIALLGAATTMAAYEWSPNPIFESLLPQLRGGWVAAIHPTFGCHGAVGLAPVLGAWVAAAWWIRRTWPAPARP